MIHRTILVLSLSATIPSAASVALGAERPAAQEGVKPLRKYTFQSVSADSPVAESSGRQSVPLKYSGSDPLEVVEGRSSQGQAVRLDHGAFQGEAPVPSAQGITVEVWFRKHGQGSQLGNGRTNGMIFCVGNGYWDGMRLSTSYPGRDLRFEIGRPQPSNSVATRTDLPVPDGVWHHVAAVWDRTRMNIYWNGLLVASGEYEGEWTPASSFKVGYGGSGIGSLKMDVDDVTVYDEALAPATIACHATEAGSPPEAAAPLLAEAVRHVRQSEWSAAEEAYRTLAAESKASPAWRALATMGAAHALRQQNRVSEAAALYTKVYEFEQAPENLHESALRLCFPQEQDVIRAAASEQIYRRLLELPEADPRQRALVRLALAERLLADGRAAEAASQYSAAIAEEALTDLETWNTRLQTAHAYLAGSEYRQARERYKRLATNSDAPRELRSLASLCMGHSYERQGDLTQAASAYEAAASYPIVLPHHQLEARERAAEVRRLERGLPRRDPTAGRARLPELPEPGAVYYVATDGDDANPGTESAPFASLARARDAIAERKQSQGLPKGGCTVLVRGGAYRVDTTFELAEADGGTAEKPIVYRAYPGEEPVFTGGTRLSGFTTVGEPKVLDRLPESARDRVLVADLKDLGIDDYGGIVARGFGLAGYPAGAWVDLYVDGEPMELARWPNQGFVQTGAVHDGEIRTDRAGAPGVFEFSEDRPTEWEATDDVWAFGYWGHLWAGRSVPIASIDQETRRVTTGSPASYGYKEGMPYYFFNVLEELDQPGEWFLDRSSGKLYLLPPKPLDAARVEFPVLDEPFVAVRGAEHIRFQGLTFELGRTEGAVFEGGRHNLLAGCVFRKLGTNGVIVRGGERHGVLGCDIHTLGAGGVRMAGGDPATLTHAGHFVENCHIHDFTRIDRVYAPAVHLDGVGNRIAHNLFHDSPHHAMRVEGYEHGIEWNEIHSVVYESDDQAGIDMFGNPAYRGNVIRFNFWHHIGSGHNVAGQAGIRLDDFISGVLVYGNVFYRCAGGRFGAVQIHGGKNNLVDNNLFVDCKYALSFSPWGEKRWLERLARESTRQKIASGGVDITTPPHSTRYPGLSRLEANPDRNYVWRSLVVDCGEFTTRERGVNELLDNHLFAEPPKLANPEELDFRLDANSPVYDRFGFRPIPFDQIGLYQDENRANWPVEDEITPFYVEQH